MPFATVPTLSYVVNLKVASDYGLRIPSQLVSEAARVIR